MALTEEQVRERLDSLNRIISQDGEVDEMDLGIARGVIAEVMQELQANSALDSILIDRDVRNVVRFIRLTRERFLETENERVGKKKVRTEKSATKKAKLAVLTKIASQANIGSFGGDALAGFPGAKPAKSESPKSLDAFATGDFEQAPKAAPATTASNRAAAQKAALVAALQKNKKD